MNLYEDFKNVTTKINIERTTKIVELSINKENSLGFKSYFCKFCGEHISLLEKFPVCCDEMIAEKEKLKKELKEELKEAKKLNVLIRMFEGGFEERELINSFSSFKTSAKTKKFVEKLKKYTKEFGEDNKNNILFFGKKGTGKTHLITATIQNILYYNKKVKAIFVTINTLLEKIRNDFDSDYPKDYLEIFKDIDILVIDDIGNEKLTEWGNATLLNIIDTRYRKIKPTFITTNLSQEEIGDVLGDRALDRLIQDSLIFNFNKGSFRKPKEVQ